MNYLGIQVPGDVSSPSFYYFFNSALSSESLIILSILKDVDELFSSHQIIQYNYLSFIDGSKILLFLLVLKKLLDAGNEWKGIKGRKYAFGAIPVWLHLIYISIFVLLGNLHEFDIVIGFLILLVICCIDVVIAFES